MQELVLLPPLKRVLELRLVLPHLALELVRQRGLKQRRLVLFDRPVRCCCRSAD